ncbi:retinoblastoma-like protein 2 isoform X2 [Archocentrus centrarchus]|uniref:retinoblastoma-like protein 2 isoform X2 n=1 Tax=Archocentrus centrarchus TaxID=63155 RepID=UPI0011E9F43E|nr:retinoblastoma-like protein 2 isoform X2 [Archocentrus centrarchus]
MFVLFAKARTQRRDVSRCGWQMRMRQQRVRCAYLSEDFKWPRRPATAQLRNNAVILQTAPRTVSGPRREAPLPFGDALYPVTAVKMSEEDESLQRARSGLEDLCRALNMDEEASGEAWKTYENISRNFTLEGSELHWLACALYVACRSSVPTVGKGTAEGNYVSLTRILRCAEMSLIEFFNKMKKWQDMAELPQDFRQSTEKLERNFIVTAVIFKKYVPIFKSIFKAPSEEPPRVHRSRKQRRHPCTVTEVFNFCWVLFVHAKGNFPMISDDLVNSYHLLLCALDLVFTNALLCNARKDLLNPGFKGLPEDFSSKDFRPAPGPYCSIEQLCQLHDGLVLEAKGVKEHFWKPFIKKLFHKRILRGKEDSLTGFLDPMNFGDSFLALSRLYEEHVLATGSLDERIFTGEGASEDIGTPGPCLCEGPENQDSAAFRLHANLTASALKVSTPLTGRKYVQEGGLASPLSSAMKSVGRLHTLLSGTKQGPSTKLAETLRSCARDPSEAISRRLKDMFDIFSQHYEDSGKPMGKDMAVKYFHLAEALYYRILESVIEREKMILGDADLSCILEQDVFHRSLLGCCLEIVIFSYRPPGDFPNVIRIFQLPAYHFYKVIEVLVRSEQGLFREVVKHLNQVEEQVLESLAWTGDSPLWESLRGAKDQVPTCQEVMPPQYLEQHDESGSGGVPVTPVSRGAELSSSSTLKGVSPSPTTLLDRYSSPPTGTARRRLFVDPADGEPGLASSGSTSSTGTAAATTVTKPASLVTAIPAGQTVVTMATATVTANNGQTVTIPVQGIANESGGITFIPVQVSVTGQAGAGLQPLSAQALTGSIAVQSPAAKPATKPASGPLRKGSLPLFFRKVYHLASVRLRDLCAKLDISSELRRKIWTCFEYSVVHCTEMMMDRHLDQLLMCAVYVMAKVTKEDRSFQNIMKCYRSQPQASSNVYRSVLISGRRRRHSGTNKPNPSADGSQETGGDISPVPIRSSSTLPAPQPGSAPSTPTNTSNITSFTSSAGEEEERGDLIHFYNNVYIKQMTRFALRYSPNSPTAGVETPSLCPYPSLRTGSPRRMLLSSKHSIYISPHKTGSAPSPTTPREKIYYYVCSSPPNRLQEINSMIRTGETPTRKRSMPLEEETSSKRVCPDSHSALLRRLQDVANDRSSSH